MKQLLQYPAGETRIADVPAPVIRPGHVLVRTEASLVSIGTERMLVDFARKSLLAKARSRPDLVRKVVDKARSEGVLTAWEATRARLDQPMPLGYSAAGVVVEVGDGISELAPGDRVAAAGAGHAQLLCVPRNLVARVPEGVPAESAAFATVAAIALHGLRLADTQLGEQVAVIGLGLIGLITVQLARAAGLRVIGFDLDGDRVERARTLGAEGGGRPGTDDPLALVRSWTHGRGVDAVLVTASTESSAPIELAAELARDRGRVVAVGAVGLEVPRRPFYMKELDLKISRSYGPGRYDPAYEEQGLDYPLAYVRWTEQRNLQAVLELMKEGALRTEPLVTHRLDFEAALEVYDTLSESGAQPLGVLLRYPDSPAAVERTVELATPSVATPAAGLRIGLLGAGLFATRTLLPALQKAGGFTPRTVCTTSGVSSRHAAEKFAFARATTETTAVLDDPSLDAVFVLTRHHLHADQVIRALDAGKHVFVEKPLCLNEAELTRVREAWERAGDRTLMVGFNRRFAPMSLALREHFLGVGSPLLIHYRVNAGVLPVEHWLHDPAIGGGRIVGEACHFIDWALWMAGAPAVAVRTAGLPSTGREPQDNVQITLELQGGSLALVTYHSNGHAALGKERIEVSGGDRSAVLDDFRSLRVFGGGRSGVQRNRLRQDKGHVGELAAFRDVLEHGGVSPTPLPDVVGSMRAAFAAAESLRSGERILLEGTTP
ncbi:MAG: bi-domain-containing oxidoreductase [Gemmatimonadota bacterium]